MATDTARDPFEWDSGGLPTKIPQGTIRDAYFAFDENYMDGERLILKLEVTSPDEDWPENTWLYPCGKGWYTPDGGKSAVHESDRGDKNFHKNSAVALLVGAMMEAGAEKELRRRAEDGHGPKSAGLYQGLTFDWERREIDYGTNRDTGEKMQAERMLPVEGSYAGDGKSSGKSAKKSGGKKQAAKKQAAEKKEAVGDSDTPYGLSPEQYRALRDLADDCESYDDWVERAYELTVIDIDDAVEEALADVSDDGLWMEAVRAAEEES